MTRIDPMGPAPDPPNDFATRTIFTTGEVAKLCRTTARSVRMWFDKGKLRGYRIPGTQDLRIPRDYLLKFMKDHGFKTDELEPPQPTVDDKPDVVANSSENEA